MAFSYTTDPSGIDFNNLPSSGFSGLKAKIKYDGNEFEYANEDGITPFINAVEINWNGAQCAETTVNTTGQLLKIINDLYNKVNNIEITKKVTKITLSPTSKTLTAIGAAFKITPTVTPTDATNKVLEWSSSNQNVATVDDNGNVIARAHGSAVITCAATDGSGVKATCSVTVNIPTTQPSTPTVTPSSTDTPTVPDTTPVNVTQNHYLPYSVMTATAQSSMDNVTSSIALAATQTSTGNYDLQGSSLTITAPSLSCLIIALPMYATSINVHYVNTVERYNSLSQGWDAMTGIKMFANTSNSKNYFVIASKATSGSKYRITFTTSKPSYVSGGSTPGGTQPDTTGSTPASTPSSTAGATTPQTTKGVS